jgi:F-type H+-transporting ATPase subunit gamma
MTQDFERVKSRLDNIKAIEPLLGALRTMSMGTWQIALKKLEAMAQYEQYLDAILLEILPNLPKKRVKRNRKSSQPTTKTDTILLIIGTERGLCGKFNENLASAALDWITTQNFTSYQIWATGTKMIKELSQRGVELSGWHPLQTSALPSFEDSFQITQDWLNNYESGKFNQFFIIYNQPKKGGQVQFERLMLLPYEIPIAPASTQEKTQKWPPPIIETDPQYIYQIIIHYLIASNYHKALIKSAIAEHSTRYNLMQEAKNNAEEIIEDLYRVINTERKRRITQEMQELASGAGLLDNK